LARPDPKHRVTGEEWSFLKTQMSIYLDPKEIDAMFPRNGSWDLDHVANWFLPYQTAWLHGVTEHLQHIARGARTGKDKGSSIQKLKAALAKKPVFTAEQLELLRNNRGVKASVLLTYMNRNVGRLLPGPITHVGTDGPFDWTRDDSTDRDALLDAGIGVDDPTLSYCEWWVQDADRDELDDIDLGELSQIHSTLLPNVGQPNWKELRERSRGKRNWGFHQALKSLREEAKYAAVVKGAPAT
jgi:hypothetical protein